MCKDVMRLVCWYQSLGSLYPKISESISLPTFFLSNTHNIPKYMQFSIFPKPFSYLLPSFFLSNKIWMLPYPSFFQNWLSKLLKNPWSSPIFSLWFVCFQLLRQLLDDKILCKLQKPFEMKTVEGLSIISAMSMSEQASVSSRQLSDRLLVSSIHHLDCPNIKDLEITFSNLFLFFALNWS